MCHSAQCSHEMFEGKNIHYSSVDNKPLCSFSVKVCNQRRLNGYAFCVRHILEDYTAPFKRCAYVAKSSHQMCTQPIPKNEERVYCNNHMQVLGMIPKKKRKEKKEPANNRINSKESKLPFADRVKTKFNSRKNDVDKSKNENITVNVEDPYDPYAFSDPVSEPLCMLSNSTCSSSSLPSPNTDPVRSVPQSPGQSTTRPPPNEGMSSIAKLYPELAEKLEKIKPKTVEPKVKSRMRNTYNMKFNKLQTKIAQNRIKDKLRKQETSQFLTEGINLLQNRSDIDLPLLLNSNHSNPLPNIIPPFNGTGVPHRSVASPQNLHPTHSLGYKTTVTPGLTAPDPLGIPPPPYPGVASNQNYNVPSVAPPLVLTNSDNHLSVITAPSIPTLQTAPGPVSCPTNFQLPPPPPYVSPKQPKKPPSPVLPVLCKKPQRLKCVLFEKEAKEKLKTESCVRYYSYHAKRKINNHIYINHGICSSDESSSDDEDSDMLPWQPNWFSASSDDDNNDEDEEDEDPTDIPIHIRATKLALLRARLRRQCHQCRTATRSNTIVKKTNNSEILALIHAVKEEPRASVRCLQEILRKPKKKINRSKYRGLEKRRCGYKNDKDVQCSNNVLPYTNHCIKHIMYNIDQQLFDYCTAKFADNTQCCVPIFDIKHELPLCHEHGAKADNYQKIQVAEVRKRPRKKSKPPALSRPPKKNKKKKKGRAVRPQKPIPPSSPTGDITMPDENTVPEINITTDEDKASTSVTKPEDTLSLPSTSSTDNSNNNSQKAEEKMMDNNLQGVDLEETFRHVIDKNFGELPLEQASRLLEEQDFQEVFNKIPDEAFDIFSSKNDPTAEETEELERALAAASSDIHAAKETLEQLVKGEISIDDIGEELTSILAATLQQNLQQEALQQHSDLTLPSESATTLSRNSGYNDLGHSAMDLNSVPTSINNVAYTRQVLPGHASTSSNLNTAIGNTGSSVGHSMTHHKYYSVQHTTPMSLSTQTVNPSASRSYTVGSGIPIGYQANLPYSQSLNNLPPSPHMAQPVSRNVLSNPALRSQLSQLPQQPLHHQSVIGQQLSNVGNFQQQWTTSGASQSQNFQNTNGYPSPQNQYVSNVSKYPVSAQSVPMTTDVSNMTKSDSLYSTLSHSGNVPNVNMPGTPSSVQGFGHIVSSPYTTLQQTPFTSNTSS